MEQAAIQIIEAERIHRAHMAAFGYPQPPRADSIIFAIQEFAEWLDAAITRANPAYKRNNDKEDPEPVMEMGDMLSMIATAILDGNKAEPSVQDIDLRNRISYLLLMLATSVSKQETTYLEHTLDAAIRICTMMHGQSPLSAQAMTHAKIRNKWAEG